MLFFLKSTISGALYQKKGLVVDDKPIGCFPINSFLKDPGVILYSAYNQLDAINLSISITPDLILLDKVLNSD